MRSAPRSYRDAERDALAPLLEAALLLHPDALPAFLDDLRRDAPTVATRLADLLARTSHPTPDPGAPAAPPNAGRESVPLPAAVPQRTIATTAALSSAARALAA